ncbi:MAG: hypothetical protein VX335_05225 [Pseudomonadota bacterium]|nr:hypothetical protein [Pseudomonadota bacterium]
MKSSFLSSFLFGFLVTLLLATFTAALYFSISGLTYGLVLLMPSVLMLPTYQSYFALLGVVGLATTIISSFTNSSLEVGIYNGVAYFVLGIVPFFIAIAHNHSAYIPSSFLNLSSINIAILTVCFLNTFFIMITGDKQKSSRNYYQSINFNQIPYHATSLLYRPNSAPLNQNYTNNHAQTTNFNEILFKTSSF